MKSPNISHPKTLYCVATKQMLTTSNATVNDKVIPDEKTAPRVPFHAAHTPARPVQNKKKPVKPASATGPTCCAPQRAAVKPRTN